MATDSRAFPNSCPGVAFVRLGVAAVVALDDKPAISMRMVEQMEVAGFRFTIEPAFDAPLTMNEHVMFNEACERWRQSVMLAMQPWLEQTGLRLAAKNGEVVDPPPPVQADLEAPSATGKLPNNWHD